MNARDLGLSQATLTDLFPYPKSADEWKQYCLSEEQVRQFHTDGYLTDVQLLDDNQITRLRVELAEMVDPNHTRREFFYEYHSNESTKPETVLFHALGAWRVRPAFHDLLWNPAFQMAAYQLLGTPFRMFHDQLFSKPAKHGGVVAWHQDFSYWTWTTPMAHLTCWIALDDVDTDNGCLEYIPKSHRWGLLEKTGLAGDMDAVKVVLTDEQLADFERKTLVEMPAGYASFHHPLMMHGSYENRSERQRRATIINVFADGVVSNLDPSTQPGSTGYPEVRQGEPMQGTYYPLLFDPQEALGPQKSSVFTVTDI